MPEETYTQWAKTRPVAEPNFYDSPIYKDNSPRAKHTSPFYYQDLVVDLLNEAKEKGKVLIPAEVTPQLLGLDGPCQMKYNEMVSYYDALIERADALDKIPKQKDNQNDQEPC